MRAFSQTAILYFGLSPQKEALRKPIFKSYESALNVELYSRLETQALTLCEDSGITFFHFDEKLQRGEGFTDRFLNAIEDVFSYGYTKLIIMGNDSPGLSSELIINSACRLEEGKSFIAPNQHGGISCLSISLSVYDRGKFESVRWQGKHTYGDMVKLLGSTCATSTELVEIEQYADLFDFLDSAQEYSVFYAFVMGLLSPFMTQNSEPFHLSSRGLPGDLRFRGPPFKA